MSAADDDWELEKPPKTSANDDWELETKPVDLGDADSPLRRALATQKGDVVSVDTPQGPAQFTRNGERVLSSEESGQMLDSGMGRFNQDALKSLLAFTNGASNFLTPKVAAVKGAVQHVFGGDDQPSISDAARAAHDHAKEATDEAGQEHPLLQIAGGVASNALVPNPAAGAGFLARAAPATYQAALSGFGDSQARSLDEAARDTGVNALAGLAFHGGSELLAKPLAAASGALSKSAQGAGQMAMDFANPAGSPLTALKEIAARAKSNLGPRLAKGIGGYALGNWLSGGEEDHRHLGGLGFLAGVGGKELLQEVTSNPAIRAAVQRGGATALKGLAIAARSGGGLGKYLAPYIDQALDDDEPSPQEKSEALAKALRSQSP